MEKMEIKLMHDSFTEEELDAVMNCLRSGEYTQGRIVKEFEEAFARWNGSKYGVMVNSGSSANLIMVALLKEKYDFQDGDEIIVPSVTWPTTIYPLIQYNLKPVLCDVDESFNISLESIRRMLSPRTKAIFLVHLLGQPANMSEIIQLCKDKNIILIEDCCESLGSSYNKIKVGNFGIMGSFSFYFGHHMTTIEGGMVVTDDSEIYDLLKSIRSHGWVRGSSRVEKYKALYDNTDFIFDMMGYNLRSTNINAALGLIQLKKLDSSLLVRKKNHELFESILRNSKKVKLQKVNFGETTSFSFGLLCNSKEERDFVLKYLPKQGIECRPIVAGNLIRQPVFQKLKNKYINDICLYADAIHDNGLYLPNNQFIDEEKVKYMAEKVIELLNIYEKLNIVNSRGFKNDLLGK
ncbi:MAG: DegT/DnrJ/EryC1/StrS family aminotransferase [Nanoarchaeota archaeon]|nr:DegT/DnrJ/EryC1/StrS family aminotransferase [Nanoarchaeota archaeon]